jgi:hypothetical protein
LWLRHYVAIWPAQALCGRAPTGKQKPPERITVLWAAQSHDIRPSGQPRLGRAPVIDQTDSTHLQLAHILSHVAAHDHAPRSAVAALLFLTVCRFPKLPLSPLTANPPARRHTQRSCQPLRRFPHTQHKLASLSHFRHTLRAPQSCVRFRVVSCLTPIQTPPRRRSRRPLIRVCTRPERWCFLRH